MKFRLKKRLILLLSVLLLLSACGNLSADDDGGDDEQNAVPYEEAVITEGADETEAAMPVYEGELRLSMRSPETLNPILNADASVDRILHLIFEPLFNIDENFRAVPNLAQSYELSADGLSAVITLRNDITWSDGMPVTSGDFVYTVDALKNAPDDSIYKSLADNIKYCNPFGENAVLVEFEAFVSGMEYMFTFPLIPRHYYITETNKTSPRNMTPLGNGPYRFVSLKKGSELTLSTAATGGKIPYIQNVSVFLIPDNETDIHAFNQGITDAQVTNYAAWNKYRSVREVNVYELNTASYDFIGFNYNNRYLQNRDLREAVARSVDMDELINSAYLGSAVKTLSPVNPDSWLYDTELTDYSFDLVLAEELLRQNGSTSEDGSEKLYLRLLVNKENSERVKIAENLAKNLNNIGMEITLEAVNFDEYTERLKNKDFDMFVGGFNLSVFPDLSFAFHSSSIDSGSNFFSYSDPELDAMLRDVLSATNVITLTAAVSGAQRRINEELAVVSLTFRKSVLLTNTRLKIPEDTAPMMNNVFSGIREWYIVSKD